MNKQLYIILQKERISLKKMPNYHYVKYKLNKQIF